MTTPEHPTPSGVARPKADSMQDLEDIKRGDVDLSESEVMNLSEPKRWAYFVRLMKRARDQRDETKDEMTAIKQHHAATAAQVMMLATELRSNSRASVTGATFAKIAAFAAAAWPTFQAVSAVLGQWGDAHPDAKHGIVGVILLVLGAVGNAKRPVPHVASSATVPTPPPVHS